MDVQLMMENEVKERLAKIVVERKHWIFLPGLTGSQHLCDLEEQFYSGELNKGFDILIGPMGGHMLVSVAFALKKHLTPAKLAKFLKARVLASEFKTYDDPGSALPRNITAEMLKKHDILFLCNPQEAAILGKSFYEWLEPTVHRLLAERKDKEAVAGFTISE